MNDILSKNIVDIIKDIKESKENVKEETVSIINRIFFSYSKANLKANIVLVLGGLSDIRAIVGTNLSKKNNIPIIFSGGVFHSKFGVTEAEYYKKIGIGYGLKDGLIYIENDSTNTYENFLYSLDLIKEIIQKDIINIFVVSNSIHLPRAILIGNEIINKNNYNMKLDEIADIEVFKPLSMKRATFHPNVKNCAPTEQTIDRGLIRGIVHDETAFYSGRILGHAGLFCDINDACKFVKMILNDGMVSNKFYLEKKYIDMLFHPEVLDVDGVKRSIGWVVGKVNSTGNSVSENTISHNGFTGTSIVIDRDNKIGIVVLSNRVHPTRENNLLLSRRKKIIGSIYNKIYIEKDTNLN